MGRGVNPKFRTALYGRDVSRVQDCGNPAKVQVRTQKLCPWAQNIAHLSSVIFRVKQINLDW